MPDSSLLQPSAQGDTMFWAGIAVALGAFGVVITCALYALSPVAAALPLPNPSLAEALSGTVAGRGTMMGAGIVGIFGDIILAAGMLAMMAFRPAAVQIERLGWALATVSVLLFTMVDALAAGVLTQVAATAGAEPVYFGFKLLFDILFILGTIAFSLGVPAILASELRAAAPLLPTPLIWSGMLASVLGLVSGLLYFAGIGLPRVIGIAVALVSVIFTVYGMRIAHAAKRM